VDVPGHERFIKHMLAGTDGFNVALFVVAADEGWMPQSEEHLAVLDLLGIRHAVVALTKIDRVDEDLAELASLEIGERLEGTTLENATIVPVSAVTGAGLEDLRSALAIALEAAEKPAQGRPRLWIDRAFTISGAGTVVTGTLSGGSLDVGNQVELHPGGLLARIRSLQSHEKDRSSVFPGSRVAANLAGLDRQEIARGAMVGRPGDWSPSDRMLVALRRARYVEDDLTNRGAYHLHMGSGSWPAELRIVGKLEDGSDVAILRTPDAVPTEMGDRFVLREVGRRSIVAGGRVIEPLSPEKGKEAMAMAQMLAETVDGSPDERATALLARRRIASVDLLRAHSGGGTVDKGVVAGTVVMDPIRANELAAQASKIVTAFHKANPLRPGIPKASLASQLGIDTEALSVVIPKSDGLQERGAAVAAPGFTATLGAANEPEWDRIREELAADGLTVPRLKDLEVGQELLHVLLREGRLTKVSDDFVYLPEQLDGLVERLSELPDRFTVSDFRDTFGLTRKYAVPLLEWLDRRRTTIREGDERRLA
jgi:selenocysteine-specific elongation factor